MEKINAENHYVDSVGIDVSKLTLDVTLYHSKKHGKFANSPKGFVAMQEWVSSKAGNLSQLIYCFEHTGWYCILLSHFLYDQSMFYCCVNAIEIKRSMGFKRGKSDKSDSYEIARYAWLRKDELKPSVPIPVKLLELQRLMSLRDQLVKQNTALTNLKKGMLVTLENTTGDTSVKIINQSLKQIKVQVKRVEKSMDELIREDVHMQENYKLSRSVKGVGRVLAIQMLVHTHNFTRFNTWRQFSAYCGLVPYPYESGTSIHGRRKTHAISDVKLKSLLSMSAVSAIQHDAELKLYYHRRVEEGKLKMVALNTIRNKIVARVFATVKRGTPYVELNKFAA